MVKLNDISVIFNRSTQDENTALNNVNLRVNEGDFITIIGSNGAGKTTLFNVISGNVMPSYGTILIDENDVTKKPEYKRAKYIGRIFQDPLLGTTSNMTIAENMLISHKKGMRGLKLSLTPEIKKEFRKELIKLNMDLEDRLGHNVGQLSGGQRQALTLLMSVISKPRLLLLDEHTAALDPKNAEIVQELTYSFIKEYKLTAMMITHNMSQALNYGNRLLMMHKGKIILDISGKEKENFTVDKLVEKFHELQKENFETDEVLLS